jgi:hypothetical protein
MVAAEAQPGQAPGVPRQTASQQGAASPDTNPVLTPVPIKTGLSGGKGERRSSRALDDRGGQQQLLIKLVDKTSDTEAMLLFIGPNQTFETKVALGTYKIRGASGDILYGEKNLFGPSTSFFVLCRLTGPSFAGDDEFQFALPIQAEA